MQRFLLVMIVMLMAVGCTTAPRSATSPLQQVYHRVLDLEERMGSQEKEVVDLKFEVNELAEKVDGADSEVDAFLPIVSVDAPKRVVAKSVKKVEASKSTIKTAKGPHIIRVSVSAETVQQALKNAGSYEGWVDGKVGPKTKAAIVDFQKNHDLKPDGIVGQQTWIELKVYLDE